MKTEELLHANRVILAHFDSYSAALLFARWENTLLAPAPLPPGAEPIAAPAEISPGHQGAAVLEAVVARYGLNRSELTRMDDFDAWFIAEGQPIRVHVLRFTGFEAPAELLAAHGASFKHLPQLRGSDMGELLLLREVFNLLVGGAQRAGA